jgi:hypothetical protein
MQLDGELHDLDAGTRVAATIAPAALNTVT